MGEAASSDSFYFSCSSLASLISSVFHYAARALSQDLQDKDRARRCADGKYNTSFFNERYWEKLSPTSLQILPIYNKRISSDIIIIIIIIITMSNHTS